MRFQRLFWLGRGLYKKRRVSLLYVVRDGSCGSQALLPKPCSSQYYRRYRPQQPADRPRPPRKPNQVRRHLCGEEAAHEKEAAAQRPDLLQCAGVMPITP